MDQWQQAVAEGRQLDLQQAPPGGTAADGHHLQAITDEGWLPS